MAAAFHRLVITSDARAACLGAHAGLDGGIIIIGTGSIGWGIAVHQEHRVGGWGFPISDEGSGASLGCEALRRVLWAHDGLIPWTDLLRTLFERFGRESFGIVHWMSNARPRNFASLAPTIVEHARQGDATACELMQSAAGYIDTVAARLRTLGVPRLSLMGGLAVSIQPFLSHQKRSGLVAARGMLRRCPATRVCGGGLLQRMEAAHMHSSRFPDSKRPKWAVRRKLWHSLSLTSWLIFGQPPPAGVTCTRGSSAHAATWEAT